MNNQSIMEWFIGFTYLSSWILCKVHCWQFSVIPIHPILSDVRQIWSNLFYELSSLLYCHRNQSLVRLASAQNRLQKLPNSGALLCDLYQLKPCVYAMLQLFPWILNHQNFLLAVYGIIFQNIFHLRCPVRCISAVVWLEGMWAFNS